MTDHVAGFIRLSDSWASSRGLATRKLAPGHGSPGLAGCRADATVCSSAALPTQSSSASTAFGSGSTLGDRRVPTIELDLQSVDFAVVRAGPAIGDEEGLAALGRRPVSRDAGVPDR